MTDKIKMKFCLKEEPTKILFRGQLSEFPNFEKLKEEIIKSIRKKAKNITSKDKYILFFEGFQLTELKSVWDSNTYKYFYDRIKSNPPESIKFLLEKVTEYPPPPKFPEYATILKNSLKSKLDSTIKKIENELTENYLHNGERKFILEKKEKEKTEDLFNDLHVNIICNRCLNPNFSGSRYICAECNNYNLCENCQEKSRITHNPEHTFIRLDIPNLIDIQKYNCLLSPNKLSLKKPHEPFEIKIKVKNNGEEDIERCFISPIRFGKNYLGCLKKTITKETQNGGEIDFDILIKFEDDDENEIKEEYEGYFRFMTEEGIPFGDILYIQLSIEK